MSQAAAKAGALSYEQAKQIAASGDGADRCRLAARTDVRPEILYFLAEDSAADVRRAIAANPETPVQADLLLARDRDDDVRCDLAWKVGWQAPELDDQALAKVREITLEILQILARDQVARVRQVLAEALKDVARPPELAERVIGVLARDLEIDVAAPVLERSPLLTDADLIDIIKNNPVRGALAAIAARHGISGKVADAIVAGTVSAKGKITGAADAVTRLLANPSAQIREETLDRIVGAAPAQTAWHQPLVERPTLPGRILMRVAEFVTEALLDKLTARKDLDPETAAAVGKAVKKRLARETGEETPDKKKKKEKDPPQTALEKAKKMHAEGQLTEEALEQALMQGKRAFVKAGLTVLAELPEAVVEKIFDSKSAKAITALAWKAGLDMRFAVRLQTRLAGIPPNKTLNPRNGTDFPLSEKDLKWQIEFFAG
ncbi:MAG: DUF2336 domain-containing protein [Alphaproteobacteria bacterium]|nr:DUF2336 domain-containing protein [Alphaproteobacteria bacterium]